ncbi:MAG: septum site-determining protein MinC [Lachnospiraceae bacterium]|nr:septum site-determining protein MinC [Lachnospiraceae bacterium]
MSQSVVIKRNKYGMTVILDKEKEYDSLKKDVEEKFKQSAKFFNDAQVAVCFQGKELDQVQENELVQVITDNSELKVICIVDEDKERERLFKSAIDNKDTIDNVQGGQFYKGTLRSGQLLESDASIIILGDVNRGAKVVAAGNIIVLGMLKGTVYAGANGNANAFVVALDMDPMQIRVAEVRARKADETSKKSRKRFSLHKPSSVVEPQIAYVQEDNIYIEPITREVLRDMPF